MNRVENSTGRNLSGASGHKAQRALTVAGLTLALSLGMAGTALADLGTAASSAATAGVTDAVVVAGIIVAFAVGYRLIRKVTG